MKTAFRAGFAGGAVLGLCVALGMDLLLGKTVGTGWSEAVANDLNRTFSTAFLTSHPVVLLGAAAVVGLVCCIGGLMGGGFCILLARMARILSKKSGNGKGGQL